MKTSEHEILKCVIQYQNEAIKATKNKNAMEYTANLNRIIGIGKACEIMYGKYSEIYKEIINRLELVTKNLQRNK